MGSAVAIQFLGMLGDVKLSSRGSRRRWQGVNTLGRLSIRTHPARSIS